ncbi:MAG: GNAT family N-acetyltransferase [Rubrivivax sp.]
MHELSTRALDTSTWDDFAALVQRHGGVWGGCWCLAFHAEGAKPGPHRREAKACRVREGRAHAALVYDAARCVGWCQYGPTAELPRIKRRKACDAARQRDADWRITCFFVDREHRGRGVAATALQGALALIAQAGGGRVESYPEDAAGRRVSASFLHNGSLAMFERAGFERVGPVGAHHWLVSRQVGPLR